MPSVQMREFIAALRSSAAPRVLADRPLDVTMLRAAIDARYEEQPMPPDMHVERVCAPVAGEWVRPTGGRVPETVLYLHGGGYIAGRPAHFRRLIAGYASAGGQRIFTLDYRLAPEHPFPAAVQDAVRAYRWLLDDADPAAITLGGDSAGAGLALSLLLAAAREGLPPPRGAFLLSPWTDLTLTSGTMNAEPGDDPWSSRQDFAARADLYLAGADPASPLASPLHGPMAGLPPLHIEVGTADRLLDDARALAANASAAHVDVRLEITPGAVHCFPMHVPAAPESAAAIGRIASFLRRG